MDNNPGLPQEGSMRLLRKALPWPGMQGEITHQALVQLYLPYVVQSSPPLPLTQRIDALALNSTPT